MLRYGAPTTLICLSTLGALRTDPQSLNESASSQESSTSTNDNNNSSQYRFEDDEDEDDDDQESMHDGAKASKSVPIVDVLRALLRALDRTARTHPA